MPSLPADDLFERYESQYARDLDGRLIQIKKATQTDLHTSFTVTIDGQTVTVPKATPETDDQGLFRLDAERRLIPRLTTIYDAAAALKDSDRKPVIPVLCHQDHVKPVGVCRVCSVLTTRKGVTGGRLVPACQHPIVDRMEVHSLSSKALVTFPGETQPKPAGDYVRDKVKVLVELLSANHVHADQPADARKYHNELLALAEFFKVPMQRREGSLALQPETPWRRKELNTCPADDTSAVITLDHNNCILCDRCVRACSEVKPFRIIGHTGFGNKARISFDLDQPMAESGCVSCGECAVSCPTGALTFKGSIYQGRDPWRDPGTSPAGLARDRRPETVKAEELRADPARYPLFAGVPYAFLKWNEGAVGRLAVEVGDVLCREGDYGSTAFLLEKQEAEMEVVVGGQVVGHRTPDDIILGEMACMNHQPRTATLRVTKPGSVMVVRRNILHVLQRNPVARKLLLPAYRRRALETYLGRGQLFDGLSAEDNKKCVKFLQSRAKGVKFLQVDPGQAIRRYGDKADSFYILCHGHVKVWVPKPDGGELVLDCLGPGRHFGEIGLLTKMHLAPEVADSPAGCRTASCSALDHVELVEIDGEAFADLLGAVRALEGNLTAALEKLLEKNRQRRRKMGELLGPFLDQGLYQGKNLLVLDLVKCTRCQECVKGCADSHDGVTRLILEGNRFGDFLVPSACRSCHDPVCLVGCPVDAIHRRPADPSRPGVQSLAIVVENHCIGCGLCSLNCPFGSIHMHAIPDPLQPRRRAVPPGKQEATNCDLCESLDGNPRCVRACPHDAAHRMTGFELARDVGLDPLGPAPPRAIAFSPTGTPVG